MDYAVYYKGELVDVTTDKLSDYFGFHSVTSLGRMVDFANGSCYIGYLLGYLVLAFTLMGIAFYLSNKQEQSKQGFYFDFGRYLFCGLLCGCFTVVMLLNATTVLHKILIIAAAVLLFIILEYSMKPDRKRLAANNIKTE